MDLAHHVIVRAKVGKVGIKYIMLCRETSLASLLFVTAPLKKRSGKAIIRSLSITNQVNKTSVSARLGRIF